MVFKILKEKITEHQLASYILWVLIRIGIMQRLDRFVFWDLKLYEYPLPYRYWFWGILFLIAIGFSIGDILLVRKYYTRLKVLVLSLMLPWLCWAGILDFMYFTDPPLVSWLYDISYVWDWHPVYLFTQFPWTILHQIPWTIAWIVGYFLLYKWAN